MVAKNLLDDALALPAADRQELAERLWESLQTDPDAFPLTDAQKAELDRRIAETEANPDDEMTLEEVEAELRKLK